MNLVSHEVHFHPFIISYKFPTCAHNSSYYLFPGNSVAVFVHGFEPYFYVEAPSANFSPDDCIALAEVFNVRAYI